MREKKPRLSRKREDAIASVQSDLSPDRPRSINRFENLP
jgi:hypothetical protein